MTTYKMKHSYKISGMTCSSCKEKVHSLLSTVKGIIEVSVDLEKGEAEIIMDRHIATTELKLGLKNHPKYQLSEKEVTMSKPDSTVLIEEDKSWLEIYLPILLIFAYITGVTILVQVISGEFNQVQWMNHFMAGFFLVFSFFKLLNLRGFAESYAMYDIVAMKIKGYSYLYAFIELSLGIAYLIEFNPLITNVVTFIVMSISIVGVLKSVLNKQKIKCACLGDVFNLPMSTITIIEDALMIAMSAMMLINMM